MNKFTSWRFKSQTEQYWGPRRK